MDEKSVTLDKAFNMLHSDEALNAAFTDWLAAHGKGERYERDWDEADLGAFFRQMGYVTVGR